ncbi:di-trans,poly-cis-decaprenylcistransferase [Halobacteriovorax marinus]|uniref:Isoprenyl transferase n=1 Tax=Halobacteriovorax marinus (strain ATCC BAA-682 / DSM 15412 / SJ) TaxID=862908 RepID=E1X2W9_HALMS|nr:polyprenyl diphosphate synthase [Halobacteriovorax marinus]ATH06592.1 di-trans,poly-cis-decaprenylcistransferase [Halobacteriovorax marinus]CBW25164.1 undecaprenyl pyrophosphate synthetase [Halobacteriovorax marinus SJ]
MKETNLKHIAIIMDGNGRWAQSRSHERIWGHIRGSKIVSNIVEEADDLGAKALTLYAFSTENWSRPVGEVKVLFKLLKKFLLKERNRILKNNIQFKVMGDITKLPEKTQSLIAELENDSKDNKGLKLTFAFGYGGRDEIVQAANKFIKENPGKELTEELLQSYLLMPHLGDVDLLIRTGGDQRISNFLLWQSAYAELYFTQTKWPDFTRKEFKEIFEFVSKRERRFGNVCSSDLQTSKMMAVENKELITNL